MITVFLSNIVISNGYIYLLNIETTLYIYIYIQHLRHNTRRTAEFDKGELDPYPNQHTSADTIPIIAPSHNPPVDSRQST